MTAQFVNIHTHRPTGRGIELRTAGIHPWDADKEDIAALGTLTADVQAIGETGLDYARGTGRQQQLAAFRAQLALARDRQLPVVLHCVRAFEPVMLELAAREPRAVIFHGFIGSPEQARRALEKGYYLSFGVRTFSSPKTLEALRETPPGQLFLETDDSDTGIEEVYAHAAAVRGTTVEAPETGDDRKLRTDIRPAKWITGLNAPSCCSARKNSTCSGRRTCSSWDWAA